MCQGSWLEPLEAVKGQLAGILSNPPYIEPDVVPGLQASSSTVISQMIDPEESWTSLGLSAYASLCLQAEVARHEPQQALDGGGKAGLDCLQEICQNVPPYLMPGGFIGLETGGTALLQPHHTCCHCIYMLSCVIVILHNANFIHRMQRVW